MLFARSHHHQQQLAEQQSQIEQLTLELRAIRNNVAVIEFTPDGQILNANTLFLQASGYPLEQIIGQHHRMFCEPDTIKDPAYASFWQQLASGQSQHGTFLRRRKDGSTLWLEASYFPVTDDSGKVIRVMKIAKDVTANQQALRAKNALFTALDRSLAVIEFTPDGHILHANDNFLATTGYKLEQIVGKHHRLFCHDSFYRDNPRFWESLAAGQFSSGRFERRHAAGHTIWLEATYNPILDDSGKVQKVIKFAANITERVNRALRAGEVAASTSEEASRITVQAKQALEQAVAASDRISLQVEQANAISQRLQAQSDNINEIVTTIRSIADQTNLLALNAAIEAARAGESGRGFAVVADEVRTLAGRTSKATSEIASVVSANAELIAQVSQQMGQISDSSHQGHELVASVNAGIAEVEQGVQHLAETIHQIVS
ncbi:hypothetical protein CK507_01140 [Pseudomonas sp. WN033]|nr:hypothetical protein CK507_01140 [Pseudomonas sp. WN033]